VVANQTTHFACLVVGEVYLTLEVATDQERTFVMLGEDVDFCIVESLALSGLDDLETRVLHGRPKSDGLIGTATQDVLTLVIESELS
jgi:hypothetical protein